MKKIVLFLIGFMFLFSCDDDESEWRGRFLWTGIINKEKANYIIKCDTSCLNCIAYTQKNDKIGALSQGKYEEVYEKCKSLPTSPWGSTKSTDTTDNDETVPTGKLEFSSDTGTRYGFDSWKDNSGMTPEESYISVAAGDSTDFKITLGSGMLDGYDRIVAVIPMAARSYISFSKDSICDTLELKSTDCSVRIYASQSVDNGKEVYIYVYGIADEDEPVCLAGDCYGAEDKLKVIVYQSKVYNDLKIILVNSPSFSADSSAIIEGFNDIIKQGVVKIGALNIQSTSSLTWDKNGNETLDDFASYTSVPVDYIEYFDLLEAVGQYGTGCEINDNPSMIILNGNIRNHWVLSEDVAAGKDYIALNSTKNLELGTDQYIGNWFGEDCEFEWVHIKSIDTTANLIYLSDTLKYSHKLYESFYSDNTEFGFAYNSCSCIKDNPDYKTLVHEFLHSKMVGDLKHVYYNDNIMFSAHDSMTDTKMRYRPLEGDSVQNQWTDLTR